MPAHDAPSQSGETFETLAAVQEIKRKGGRVLGIVNVVGSTIGRECGRGIYVHAGPEIAVVSTKTFTCTVIAFALLAIHLGRIRDLTLTAGGCWRRSRRFPSRSRAYRSRTGNRRTRGYAARL